MARDYTDLPITDEEERRRRRMGDALGIPYNPAAKYLDNLFEADDPAAPPLDSPYAGPGLPEAEPSPPLRPRPVPAAPSPPAAGASAAPADEDPIEREEVGPTGHERAAMALAALGSGVSRIANRFSRRPQPPSGIGQRVISSIRNDIAGRQHQANLEYDRRQTARLREMAQARAQQKAEAEAALTDPRSAVSQRAWAATNAKRQEYGLPPIDQSYRGVFSAAEAKDWLAAGPQTMAARLQRQQARETAARQQQERTDTAQAQLQVMREMNVPIEGVDTNNPDAVKMAYDTAMKRLGWTEAEKRARIAAAAQRQQEQVVSTGVRDVLGGIKDPDYYASRPREAYDALNQLDRAFADPNFHQNAGSERAVEGAKALREMLQRRAQKIDGFHQIEGRPPPNEKEYSEARVIADSADKIRQGMLYLENKAPSGLTDWLAAQGGRAAQILADPDAIENNPILKTWVKSAQDMNDFKSAAAGIALGLKNFEAMGALDAGAQQISSAVSGNPTSIVSMLTGDSSRATREALDRILANAPTQMRNRGFEADEARRQEEAQQAAPGPQRSPSGGGNPNETADRIRRLWPSLTAQERAAVRKQLGVTEGWEP